MFEQDDVAEDKARQVVEKLGNHALTLSHDRHISMENARGMGVKVKALEDDNDFQDAVLTIHHACIQTFAATPAIKIIENHKGEAFIQSVEAVMQ